MGIIDSVSKLYIKIHNTLRMKIWGGKKLSLGKNVKFHQKISLFGKGSIRIADGCEFGYKIGGGYHEGRCELQVRSKEAYIVIGSRVLTNNNLFVCARGRIIIGEMCLIGRNVTIMDHNAHGIQPDCRRSSCGTIRPVTIGNNVWIGNYVTILPGTEIGDNCVVAAGSIVKGVFRNNVIIQGNPAAIVRDI